MRQTRYQLPSGVNPEQEELPLDTSCTILTRQSTVMQAMRHTFSAEVNPQDLVGVAERLGFASERIQVIDADMGIGAYSTSIDDRPGLRHWLYELLPSGESRVLLVSQVDRLFRDRWEDQHNVFIRQVAKHGGWVVCGSRVYNFRREFDCEQFRMECKYGRLYIEHHVKGRLQPAVQRAAMAGRYAGGPVPWGYIVDYDPHSLSYKHFLRYEPHATLVHDEVFRYFAELPHPSLVEVTRHWVREGLVWPFFGPDVDERRIHFAEKRCAPDMSRGGYLFHYGQALQILTNVGYLGWRVRGGQLAREGGSSGPPRICHEPLVEDDLFWWCYDHLVSERPNWAPTPTRQMSTAVTAYRPRPTRRRNHEDNPFLAAGRIRCAHHGNILLAHSYRPHESPRLICHGNDRFHFYDMSCSSFHVGPVNDAITKAFLAQLTLDERDLRELARLAQQRERQRAEVVPQVVTRIAEERARLERAKKLSLQAGDDDLAAEYLDEAWQAKQTLRALERELQTARAMQATSPTAWATAERAATLGERIKATFADWPHQAKMRVLLLALQEGALGRVNRQTLGLWLRWVGGTESRFCFHPRFGIYSSWTDEERQALREHYGQLSWEALLAMFPGRTQTALKGEAKREGLQRFPKMAVGRVPPRILPVPVVTNALAAYGFADDDDGSESVVESTIVTKSSSRRSKTD